MGILLEIRSGPAAGKTIGLKSGDSVTIGRAGAKAQFALAEDTFMSGLHFAVECGPSGSRVADRKSSNGTFLNGARIQDSLLANGDEIKAGQTVFHVRIVPDEKIAEINLRQAPAAAPAVPQPPRPVERPASPPQGTGASSPARVSEPGEALGEAPAAKSKPPIQEAPHSREISVGQEASRKVQGISAAVSPPPVGDERAEPRQSSQSGRAREAVAFSVGGWSFPAAPADWEVQEGFGLQRVHGEEFPSSVSATEEKLAGITLQQFVESQISLLRGYLRDARFEPTVPPQVAGADESLGMDVRHATKDGRELAYRHIYARSGSSVGVLTVTTLASEFPKVMESLQPLLHGAAFQSSVSGS